MKSFLFFKILKFVSLSNENTRVCSTDTEFLLTVDTSKQLDTFIFETYEWET